MFMFEERNNEGVCLGGGICIVDCKVVSLVSKYHCQTNISKTSNENLGISNIEGFACLKQVS